MQGSTKVIILKDSGVLYAGDYSISKGVTLLIQKSANSTDLHISSPTIVSGTAAAQKVCKALTMAEGANITVEAGGAINVDSDIWLAASPHTASPAGDYGLIRMSQNTSIVLKRGASDGEGGVLA